MAVSCAKSSYRVRSPQTAGMVPGPQEVPSILKDMDMPWIRSKRATEIGSQLPSSTEVLWRSHGYAGLWSEGRVGACVSKGTYLTNDSGLDGQKKVAEGIMIGWGERGVHWALELDSGILQQSIRIDG